MYAIVIGPLAVTDPADNEAQFPFVNLLTKYICAIILHMTMQPKVNDALERLYYVKRHPHKFDNLSAPLIICMFKFLVEILTEFTSLALTATCTDTKDVVMNYIALGVISELDEVYFLAIRNPLKQQFEDIKQEIPITNLDKVSLHDNLHKFEKCFFYLLKCLKFFYEAIYFHMFPYMLFLFIYFNEYLFIEYWKPMTQ